MAVVAVELARCGARALSQEVNVIFAEITPVGVIVGVLVGDEVVVVEEGIAGAEAVDMGTILAWQVAYMSFI